jgi:hypothetical protein
MRSESNTQHNTYKWIVVQDDERNYHYDGANVYITNHRAWSEKTLRLATDSRKLSQFLTQADSFESDFKLVSASGRDLSVSVVEKEDDVVSIPSVEHRGSVLDEPFFLADWPDSAKIRDLRDTMHKRGWSYFRIKGQIQGRPVVGQGRIPFIYAASKRNTPHLTLRVGGLVVADSSSGASIYNKKTNQAQRFPAGTFFQGLGRQWMGMHTLDCIRRDAATERIPFETVITENNDTSQVILSMQDFTLIYTVDLKNDLLTRIDMSQDGEIIGALEFSYLQDLGASGVMGVPSVSKSGEFRKDISGPAWLSHLAHGTLLTD